MIAPIMYKNKELIEFIKSNGTAFYENDEVKYLTLPIIFEVRGENLIQIPFSKCPERVREHLKKDAFN